MPYDDTQYEDGTYSRLTNLYGTYECFTKILQQGYETTHPIYGLNPSSCRMELQKGTRTDDKGRIKETAKSNDLYKKGSPSVGTKSDKASPRKDLMVGCEEQQNDLKKVDSGKKLADGTSGKGSSNKRKHEEGNGSDSLRDIFDSSSEDESKDSKKKSKAAQIEKAKGQTKDAVKNANGEDLASPDSGFASVSSDKKYTEAKDSGDDVGKSPVIDRVSEKLMDSTDFLFRRMGLLPPLLKNYFEGEESESKVPAAKAIYIEPVVRSKDQGLRVTVNINGLSKDRQNHLKKFLNSNDSNYCESPEVVKKLESSKVTPSSKYSDLKEKDRQSRITNVSESQNKLTPSASVDLNSKSSRKRKGTETPVELNQKKSRTSIPEPKSVSSIPEPKSVSSIHEPKSVSSIHEPKSVSSIHEPKSMSSMISRNDSRSSGHSRSETPKQDGSTKFYSKKYEVPKQVTKMSTRTDDYYNEIATKIKHLGNGTSEIGTRRSYYFLESSCFFLRSIVHQISLIHRDRELAGKYKLNPHYSMTNTYDLIKKTFQLYRSNVSPKDDCTYGRLQFLGGFIQGILCFQHYQNKKEQILKKSEHFHQTANELLRTDKPADSKSSTISIEKSKADTINKSIQILSHLSFANEFWTKAMSDMTPANKKILDALNNECGTLTLWSDLPSAVTWFYTGLTWLRKEYDAEHSSPSDKIGSGYSVVIKDLK